MKSQNYTIALPIIKEACGELAEDASLEHMLSKSKFGSELTGPAAELTRRTSVLGPGFSAPPGGPDYLNRTVMSYHYYCWALGYVSDDEADPVLTTVCDEVSIFLVTTDHCLMSVAGTRGVQHSECQGWRAGGQCHNVD